MTTPDAPPNRLRTLGVARLWYEGNAHCLLPATREAFERREWRRGEAALAAARGASTELAAVADVLEGPQRWAGWDVVVSRCASALPAGPIDDAVFDAFLAEVLADFDTAGPLDAIYLSLHGAGITATNDAPELTLLRALRARHPGVPIGASFDLHANHAPEIARLLDVACGYRTHPHVDMRETAARTLALLRRVADGEIRPVGVIRNEGLLLSSAHMRTDGAGPMAALQRLAQAQVRPPVLDVSVYGGFPYAASAHIGASVMAWADAGDRAAAERAADTVMAELRRRAPEFEVPLIAPAAGLAQALATPGLVAVTDAADNPMSGGIGDTTGLLRALVDARLAEPCVFASFADPGLVAAARAAGPGATLEARLGGRLAPQYGAPVALRAQVERLTDGRWVNTGPMERGTAVSAGATAVLRAGALRVIVCEHVVPNDDPAFYTLHGIDLAATRVLAAKAKNHFRAAFAPLCAAIVDVAAPGPATLDVASLARAGARTPAG